MEMVNRHHAEQKLIARNVVAELYPLWRILDFHELKESTPDWLRAVRPVVERGHMVSQYVAAQFAKNYRRELYPLASPLPLDVPNPLTLNVFAPVAVPDREVSLRIMASMQVTGPVHVAKNSFPGMNQMQMDEALANGFSKSAGAATRLVLNGGRGMIRLLADADPLAVGIVGVVDEDGCTDCKVLQTPLLKAAGNEMNRMAVGHDFCKCSARLVY